MAAESCVDLLCLVDDGPLWGIQTLRHVDLVLMAKIARVPNSRILRRVRVDSGYEESLGYVEQDNNYIPAALCCFRHTRGNWAALKGLLFLHATNAIAL
ncbi:MAG: hypothetical protein ACR2JB_11660 [Bryobacteraceae bacterium]